MASPLGWHLVPEILASLGRSRANQLSEWLPPGLAAWLWPFWLLAVVLVVMTVVRGRRIDRLDRRTVVLCAIALALLPLALRAVRNVPSFLLVAVPAVTSVLTPVGWKPRHSATGERTGVNAMLLGAMGAIAAGLVAAAWWISIPPLHWRPISNDAVRAIGNCQGPMYNTYGQGGFLIWFVPGQPVFIDNRQDPYPDDLLAENLELEVSGNYRAAFAKHDVRCAVVPPHSKTALALASDGGWTRTFSDAEWAVFTRP